MRHATKWMLPVLGLSALLVGWSIQSAAAQDVTPEKAKGQISGIVKLNDQPVVGAQIRLMAPPAGQDRAGRRGGAAAADDAAPRAAGRPAAPTTRPAPVAQTVTDDQGRFAFADIAPGQYVVNARDRGQGNGKARVIVKPGETVDVAIAITATTPARGRAGDAPAKGAKAGRGGRAGKGARGAGGAGGPAPAPGAQ